jgi:predicted transcriptional regulator
MVSIGTFDDMAQVLLGNAKKAKLGLPFESNYRLNFYDQATLFSTLSPERMELLHYLRQHKPMSDRQLARYLKRNQKKIQTDIKAMLRLDLIKAKKDGKYYVPWDDITIQLPLAA